MPTDWKARFEAMVEDLRRNPLIEITEEPEYGDPATDDEIAAAKAFAGGQLPDGIEDLYRSLGFFSVQWMTNDAYPYGGEDSDREPNRRGGFVRITRIQYVFTSLEGEIWFDFLAENHPFRQLKPFLRISEEACLALFPVPGDARVYYHYLGQEIWPTGLGVNEVLELVLESRGYWYALTACTNNKRMREPRWFKENAPTLFPSIELTRFVPRTSEGEVELP